MPERLSDEHLRALREAAELIDKGRASAAEVLARAGLDPGLASLASVGVCAGVPHSGTEQVCGCDGFRGDPDFCFTQYKDFTGPDIGAGAIIRVCGHPRVDHEVSF
ncbi:DUF6422 family protein [Streptomyces sp. NPDC046887]|uniref:DUF6422 family protein n=1 Tax=Streptomyces sp. NPDC046887 TaxID=3155472 RepID=UPI0034025B8F